MKKLLYLSITAFATLVSVSATKAQDIHFSQFYETSVLRNPALAGIFSGDYKVGVMYRSQWSSISAPFETALLTAETRIPIRKDFVSIGLVAYYDKAGSIGMKTTSVCPALTYNKSMEDEHQSFISVGFMGGYIQRSFDPTKMTFDEQYQNGGYSSSNGSGENIPEPKLSQWDLGAGVSFSSTLGENNTTSYYVGFAGYHLTKPQTTFFINSKVINQDIKMCVNAGMGVRISDIWRFQFQGNYSMQGEYSELMAGALLSWNKMDEREEHTLFSLHGGVLYRLSSVTSDAVVPTIKLAIHDFTVGASYDFNISSLKTATNMQGGLELSLIKTGLFSGSNFESARLACPKVY